MRCVADSAPSAPASTHSLVAGARPLMSVAIHPFGERLDTHATHGLQEFLAVLALLDVHIEQLRDGCGHFALGHRRTDDLAQRTGAAGRAADGDLVPLLAMLVDAEDADVADMMVPAGVHAAGHLDLDVAEVVQVVEVVETLVDLRGDTDRTGVGEAAEVEARAADH